MKNKYIQLSLLFIAGLVWPQGRVEGVSAIVGDNIVLHSDVLQQSQMQAFYQKIDPSASPLLFQQIYNDVLESMIDQFVVLEAAEKDTNLIIADSEVDAALDHQINEFILQAGSEAALEEAVGLSIRKIRQEYWSEIRNMMLIERFKFSKIQNITVSRVEVMSFYENNKDSLPDIPETYDFSVIEIPVVPGVAAESEVKEFLLSIKELIINGASFDSLAILHSDDPGSGPFGGNLGFTKRGSLVREYEKAAYSLDIGGVSGPVRSQFGYHLILLNKKQGEKISTQHILKIINPEPIDRELALNSIRSIYYKCDSDPRLFDSLAIVFSRKYKNFSGEYNKISVSDVPLNFLTVLVNLNEFEMSEPFETDLGFAFILLNDHNPLIKPTPNSSWALLYNLAKSYKQNELFKFWVKGERLNTLVKIYN